MRALGWRRGSLGIEIIMDWDIERELGAGYSFLAPEEGHNTNDLGGCLPFSFHCLLYSPLALTLMLCSALT